MEYGIMRIEKRSRAAVFGLQIEANRSKKDFENGRDFDCSDIDWNLTDKNFFFIKTENWNKEITRQIKQNKLKERKDSIVLLDGLYTASPEFFANKSRGEILKYFQDCLRFHQRNYGITFNAVVHFDETTPHMHVASIPVIKDEKGSHLSAKIIMGNRNDFRLRQDKFYDEVSSIYGMDRGETKTAAETKAHTTKREWQIAVQKDQLNDLEFKKEMLDFNVSSAEGEYRYKKAKLKELEEVKSKAEMQLADIQADIQEAQKRLDIIEEISLHKSRWMSSTLEEKNKVEEALQQAQNNFWFVNSVVERMITDDSCYEMYSKAYDEVAAEWTLSEAQNDYYNYNTDELELSL